MIPGFTFEGKQIAIEDGDTVLGALLRNGFEVDNRCRAGACQACLLRSDQSVPKVSQAGVDDLLIERGAFLSCQASAKDVISVERLGNEAIPRSQAFLSKRQWVADDVIVLTLEAPDWQAAPGRFVRLIHPSGVGRPYSLAAAAWEDPSLLQFHVRFIASGEMSGLLATVPVGERFEVEGPFGKCFYRSQDGNEPILLIGSGTGLAPLYGIVTDALNQGHRGPIHLYHGAATSSRLYYRDELSELGMRFPNFRYAATAEKEVTGCDRQGSPLQWALADHADLEGFKVYACGHPDLVRAAKKQCFLAGANLKDISADPFVAA